MQIKNRGEKPANKVQQRTTPNNHLFFITFTKHFNESAFGDSPSKMILAGATHPDFFPQPYTL